MSGTHFYLTLPSNASLDVFPDNKTTGYRVQLPQIVNLEGDWDVGLYSITYPHAWYTLQDNYETHLYYRDRTGFPSTAYVDYGYYTSAEDLIKAINAGLVATGDLGDDIKLSYNDLTKKVSVKIKNNCQFGPALPLSNMLGFGDEEPVIKEDTTAPYMVDLTVVSTIYTYCDIVEPQVVGDVNAPLLQTVPVEGTFGDTITKTFINTQYVPVQTKSFENVEILLRTDTGKPVPFERGKVVTTLHFRQHSYFT